LTLVVMQNSLHSDFWVAPLSKSMLTPSRRFTLAVLLLNVQSGHAARKQVERASFQTEAGDAIFSPQASAKELPQVVENHTALEVSDASEKAPFGASEVLHVAEKHESKMPASAPVGAEETPFVVDSRDTPESSDVPEVTQPTSPQLSPVVEDHEASDSSEDPETALVNAQELPEADDSHAISSEHWPPQVWLSLLSNLTMGAVTDLNPVEAVSVLFVLSCMLYSFWVFLRYGHDGTISLRLKVIENQRHQFQKAHDAFTGSTVQTLNALSESVALIAERSFEGKRRHFLKLVRRIRDHPDRVGSSSECAPAFKQLVSEWLEVFRECDLRLALSTEGAEELAEASTVDRVAVVACERLESTSAAEITRELESFMGPLTQQGVKALENTALKGEAFPLAVGCGERVSFTLLSVSHAAGLFVVLLGLALAGIQAVRQLWLAAAVFCADACLFFVVLRYDKIDKMFRLEGDVRRLRLQSRAARRRLEQVSAFHKKAEAVTHLWLHRTMPQLEIFGGLFDLLWGPLAGSAEVTKFPVLAEKLAQMRGGLGPLRTWCGEHAMHVDKMQEIAGTLCDCADFIKGQPDDVKPECLLEIIQHLDQMQLPASQETQTTSEA